jgi:NAD(P)-dependent dehydrogenase (short-subunit alcohol dehydrogenase family)
MIKFSRRSAFVTGAGGSVGRATILGLARHGVTRIAGLDIHGVALEETKSLLLRAHPDVEFLSLQADLMDENSVANVMADVWTKFGRVDYAINNAGVGQPLASTSNSAIADFDKVMAINFRGVWLCEKYELQYMQKQEPRAVKFDSKSILERGSIINVSSILGFMAMPHLGIYNSSKHAILGLTRTDAIDYAKNGIRINAVAPGFIDTPLLLEETRKALKSTIDRIPQGRLAHPEEVADAICFLGSPIATHITGVTLPVDGGMTVT